MIIIIKSCLRTKRYILFSYCGKKGCERYMPEPPQWVEELLINEKLEIQLVVGKGSMNKIGEYLDRRLMSQRELAELIGCTEVTMSRYVSGEREPKVSIALKIATALHADVYDLFPTVSDD